jgi:hypothetical protein
MSTSSPVHPTAATPLPSTVAITRGRQGDGDDDWEDRDRRGRNGD